MNFSAIDGCWSPRRSSLVLC